MRIDPHGEDMTPKELSDLAQAITHFVNSRIKIEKMRMEFEDRAKAAAAETAKLAQGKEDGEAVVERVKRILGV